MTDDRDLHWLLMSDTDLQDVLESATDVTVWERAHCEFRSRTGRNWRDAT